MTRVRPADRLHGLGITLIRRILAEAPPGAINLGLGMSNVDVPRPIVRAVRNASSLARAPYGPNAGLPALREAIAARYGVAASRVIITNGVQQGIALAMFGVVNPGDEVVVPAPGFPVYATLAELAGGEAIPWRLRAEDRFRPTARGLSEALGPRTRLAVGCSPGDPTGAVATCNATNFFVVRGGELWTSTGHYNLHGITRAVVLEVARASGIVTHEVPFSLTDVYAADEAFVTGTFGALTPVREVDGRHLRDDIGPVTARLAELYREAVAVDVAARS